MKIKPLRPFELERFYAKHEFTTPLQLSASDCESLSAQELLNELGGNVDTFLQTPLGYTETRGSENLRAAIAEHYPGRESSDVLVGNAPQELIYAAMMALVEPGDRVVTMQPCYASLQEVARSQGAEIVPWHGRQGEAGWTFDLAELEELLSKPTRLLVTNMPHNPTGFLPAAREWAQVAEWVDRCGAHWFSDEMYHRLERGGEDHLAPAASLTERAISLWGLSKSFGLPGLRLGWLVSADRSCIQRIEELKDYLSICTNALSEHLGELVLRSGEEILRRNQQRIAHNATLMRTFSDRHPDQISWQAPLGGPVSLATLLREPALVHSERIRRTAGVLLVPSALFGLEDRHLRIGLGRANFQTALDAWESAL